MTMPRLGLAIVVMMWASGVAAQDSRCRVTDPTGTPLNVRSAPGGSVGGKIANGKIVAIIEQTDDARGRSWVRIADGPKGKPIGWVFREFVSCF